MYNKLFTKILDSSIWLESDSTRIVWLTLLSAMDEDGFAQFASVANLAHRARVAPEACAEAVKCLENPDANSADPDHEGRRIERVNGGWIILNAEKYRLMVTRVIAREQTRERVRRFRAKTRNAIVTDSNDKVTPSEAYTETETEAEKSRERARVQGAGAFEPGSLPRDHMRHAICGPSMRICLLSWQYDALVKAYNAPENPSGIRAVIAQFLEQLESGLKPQSSIGPFSWIEKEFHAYLKSVGRVAPSIQAKSKPFSVEEAMARKAAAQGRPS